MVRNILELLKISVNAKKVDLFEKVVLTCLNAVFQYRLMKMQVQICYWQSNAIKQTHKNLKD